jgi:hypothetical protein
MQDTRYHGSLTAFTRMAQIVVDAVFADFWDDQPRVASDSDADQPVATCGQWVNNLIRFGLRKERSRKAYASAARYHSPKRLYQRSKVAK